MKNRIRNIILAVAAALPLVAAAQDPYKGSVSVAFEEKTFHDDSVTVRAAIDLGEIRLNRNNKLTFTSSLRSEDGKQRITMDSLTVAGHRRAKAISREARFSRSTDADRDETTVIGRKQSVHPIELEYTVPFEKWMRRSRMVVEECASGCCDDMLLYADGSDRKIYRSDIYGFPDAYRPAFAAAYITPETESVKIQSETYSARLYFKVNRTELLRSFGDNARILDETDNIIERIGNDSLLTIRRIVVRGYASPEGSESNNLRLAQGRAQAFVDYLQDRHRFHRTDHVIWAEGAGEDWAGLSAAVAASGMADGREILDIIDNTHDVARRKSRIEGLSGGHTYRLLLDNIYPSLRRNEYTIEYEVCGLNAEEARRIIKTHPHLLSLNEMFMVANLYDRGSDEYKEIFEIASRQYPDSPVAQFNTATAQMETGNYTPSLITCFEAVQTAEAWNNLAILHWHEGRYAKAKELFEIAARAGLPEAAGNISQYRIWDEDRTE